MLHKRFTVKRGKIEKLKTARLQCNAGKLSDSGIVKIEESVVLICTGQNYCMIMCSKERRIHRYKLAGTEAYKIQISSNFPDDENMYSSNPILSITICIFHHYQTYIIHTHSKRSQAETHRHGVVSKKAFSD